MTHIDNQDSELISQCEPAPSNQTGADQAVADRRADSRWVHAARKTVTVLNDVVATVRDESEGGACLKMSAKSEVTMGQQLTVEDDENKKIGRVCWTTVDNFGSHRLVGLAWVK